MSIDLKSENLYTQYLTRGKDEAKILGTSDIVKRSIDSGAADQLLNMSSLPGVIGLPIGLPDIHKGYGFPIGSVVAMDPDNGSISPGGVGYDINCGVALISTGVDAKTMRKYLRPLLDDLSSHIPVGTARSRNKLTESQIRTVVEEGIYWPYSMDMATEDDLIKTDFDGHLFGVDEVNISKEAYERGMNYFGTLGSGNHFLEVQRAEELIDHEASEVYGLVQDMAYIMIHTGSRGLGHQVATDYLEQIRALPHNLNLPDPQLSHIMLGSREADRYISAMNGAANYGFANRQFIIYQVRKSLTRVLGREFDAEEAQLIYNISHNLATFEDHHIEGRKRRLLVHRKGATRALPPDAVQGYYSGVGHPVLVPGSMGSASYVLRGKERNDAISMSTCSHGAGRSMGRKLARESISPERVKEEMKRMNIEYTFGNEIAAVEESRESYKNIDEVYAAITGSNIATGVAKLFPMGVLKG